MINGIKTNIKSFTEKIDKSYSLKYFDNLYIFLLLLYAGRSCSLMTALMFPTSYVSTGLFLLMTIKLIRKHQISFGKEFKVVFFIITAWVVLQFFKTKVIEPMSLFLYLEFFFAYVAINVYKSKILDYFVKYCTWLAIISLIVWGLYLVMPGIITAILEPFNQRIPGRVMKISVIIASISGSSSFLGMRNAGFCNEPGYYASILSLALIANLIVNSYKISLTQNKSFYILLFSLITTQSTTGYITFLFVILFYVYNTRSSAKYIVIISTIVLLPTVLALPFMSEKINEYMYEEGNEMHIEEAGENQGENQVYVPQRIDGFVLELYNLKDDPILGFGMKSERSWVGRELSPNIVLSNGIIKILSQFGLIFGSLFYLGVIVSLRDLQRKYNFSGWYIFFAVYLCVSFSYDFNMVPFLLCIWQSKLLINYT